MIKIVQKIQESFKLSHFHFFQKLLNWKYAKYYPLNFCLLAILKSYTDISDRNLAFIQIFPMCRIEIYIKFGLKLNFFMFPSQFINVLHFLRPCSYTFNPTSQGLSNARMCNLIGRHIAVKLRLPPYIWLQEWDRTSFSSKNSLKWKDKEIYIFCYRHKAPSILMPFLYVISLRLSFFRLY